MGARTILQLSEILPLLVQLPHWVCMSLIVTLTGFVSSADLVKQQAQERYLSAVAPNILH